MPVFLIIVGGLIALVFYVSAAGVGAISYAPQQLVERMTWLNGHAGLAISALGVIAYYLQRIATSQRVLVELATKPAPATSAEPAIRLSTPIDQGIPAEVSAIADEVDFRNEDALESMPRSMLVFIIGFIALAVIGGTISFVFKN